MGDTPPNDERLTNKGVESWHAAEMDRAEEFFRAAMAQAREVNAPETGSLLQWIAKVHMEKGELKAARVAFRDALARATATSDLAAEAVILLNYASLLKTVGETSEALTKYERAAELADRLQNHRGHAHALGNIANVHRVHGELDRSLELRQKALVILHKHGTPRDLGNSMANMGSLLRSMGRLRESQQAFRKAIEYLEQAGATRSLVITHTNLAGVQMDAGRLDDAADLLTSAIGVAEANELPLQQTSASVQMARLELKRRDADAALELAEEALDPRLPAAEATRIEAHIVAGLAHLELKQRDEARHNFMRAYEKSKAAESYQFTMEALCLLAEMEIEADAMPEARRLLGLLPDLPEDSQVYARFALPLKLRLAKYAGDTGVGELIAAANESLKRWQAEGDRETAARIRSAIN